MVPKLKATFFVPDLDMVFLEEGNHFVREKHPKQVNELILNSKKQNFSNFDRVN